MHHYCADNLFVLFVGANDAVVIKNAADHISINLPYKNMTDRYAVFGHPVAHSKSPEIHAAFALASGEALTYERVLVPLDGFLAAIEAFRAGGGRGASITLPFKLEAYSFANDLSERARAAGAVNTLKFEGAQVFGDNTDGIGLCRDIVDNLKVPIKGARILLIGAGGAARGAMGPLLSAEPNVLVTTNRTFLKSTELAAHFSARGPVLAISSGALASHRFDIVINATSASIEGAAPQVPSECIEKGGLAYEMMYGKEPTPFMVSAAMLGARVADGLGMLVEQAAEAFYLWRGVRPTTSGVIAELRSKLRPRVRA